MGICSSCLGGRRRKHAEGSETSRLLFDDPYRSNYGSRAGNPRRLADEADTEHIRREREVLESIAHGMSEGVLDIFTILPDSSEDTTSVHSDSPPQQTNGFEEEDARAPMMAYRTVKKAHIDKISSPMTSSKHDWKDVKAAVG
ncbi:MAG: hypothetical protein L6R41_002786 [Letrouitia leprolyta]|nr:MAG: hypothetical protein L6R41_002786 [Letrouitia leprolyta]